MDLLPGFFVLEGLDGAGTTTQLQLLETAAAREDVPMTVTAEPTKELIGLLIRRILSGEIKADPRTIAHLFAADRSEHLFASESGIVKMIGDGRLVVSDRYLFSSLAYQAVVCGFDFVAAINASFPMPAAVFYIRVSTDTAIERSSKRSHIEIYENREFQKSLQSAYERALSWGESRGSTIYTIDGELPRLDIHRKIWSLIRSHPIQ